ncbi:glycosyltransferase [Auraticoccus sp. F435]|uniref:Glycosyltransferase n=1 Tax=Auraticoccus cholistanensis TaxID=2656650 RepID=A0A6A9V296_9ACTN|nr:glycosyltransferase family A protein [Auraticoccus cholistanensis]MVA77756.1 glycosyltransferase [Auraticoccus cholistanensis]
MTDDELARFVHAFDELDLKVLERTALRNESRAHRRMLAYLAGRGRVPVNELLDLECWRSDRWLRQVKQQELDVEALTSLAYVLALQGSIVQDRVLDESVQTDRQTAIEMFDHVRRTGGMSKMQRAHALVYLDLLTTMSAPTKLRHVLSSAALPPCDTAVHRLDSANPSFHPEASWADWLERLHEYLPTAMKGLCLLPDARTPFDGLWAPSGQPVDDGPVVSVVVSVYNPTEHLFSAIDSILRQSYTNLEIIVVDDASAATSDRVLQAVASKDSRIRVLRMAVNGGTYRCRNYALSVASGKYVTFHDDDDWAHPQRIARQVAAMQAGSGVVASLSYCIRATEQLSFVRVGYHGPRLNASSLMFDRRKVTARIGFFDSVRKGADSEYANRIQAVFGKRSLIEVRDVLAVVRVGQESLSTGDFRPGWRHRSRWAYRMQYTRWHETLRRGTCDGFIGTINRDHQHFPAPRKMTGSPTDLTPWDVVVVSDWRDEQRAEGSMALVDRLTAKGSRVAVAQLEDYRAAARVDVPLVDKVADWINSQVVDLVLSDDPLRARTVVVAAPELLQFADPRPTSWTVAEVLIATSGDSMEPTASTYDPGRCQYVATALYGAEARWRCASEAEARFVREAVEASLVEIGDAESSA